MQVWLSENYMVQMQNWEPLLEVMGVNKSMKQAIFLWTISLDQSIKEVEIGETEKRKPIQGP